MNSTFASNAAGAVQIALSNGGVSTSNVFVAQTAQLGNVVANRRLVLFSEQPNDHQFSGFGINSGMVRYQVNAPQNVHAWFGGTSATTSTEIMRCSVNNGLSVTGTATSANVVASSNVRALTGFLTNGNSAWGCNAQLALGWNGTTQYAHVLKSRHQGIAALPQENAVDVFVWQPSQGPNDMGSRLAVTMTAVGTGVLTSNPLAPLDVNGGAIVRGNLTCSNVSGTQATFSNAAGMGQITVGGVMGHVTIKGSNIGFGPIIESGPNADIGLNFVGGCNAARGGAFRSHGYLRINQHGCIGIHEAIPRAIHGVQWNQTLTNRKIVLWDAAPAFPFGITDFGNDHEFYGLGVQSFEQRYQVGPLGRHAFYAAVDGSSSTEIMRLNHNRTVSIGNAGSVYGLSVASQSNLSPYVATFIRGGDTLMNVTMFGNPVFDPATTASVLQVGRDQNTNRSISCGGGVGTNGLDYAEYWYKSDPDVVHAKGDVVGVDATGRLTDRWDAALHFVVKSTDPGLVGGDCWCRGLVAGTPEYELARRGVDRVALCGRVPCNVQNGEGEWHVGGYIVPRQGAGNTIEAACVAQQDMTFQQHLTCVGRVIEAGVDGRPIVLVKAV